MCKHPLIPTVKFLEACLPQGFNRNPTSRYSFNYLPLGSVLLSKMIFPVFPCSLPHNKNRLSISSTSLTLSAINFYTDAVLKVAVQAPTFAPLVFFVFANATG